MSHLALPSVISHDIFAILISSIHNPASLPALLNDGNVYQVLLQAQLLHMADTVAACKLFLHQRKTEESLSSSSGLIYKPKVVRPIASKAALPPPTLPVPMPETCSGSSSQLMLGTAQRNPLFEIWRPMLSLQHAAWVKKLNYPSYQQESTSERSLYSPQNPLTLSAHHFPSMPNQLPVSKENPSSRSESKIPPTDGQQVSKSAPKPKSEVKQEEEILNIDEENEHIVEIRVDDDNEDEEHLESEDGNTSVKQQDALDDSMCTVLDVAACDGPVQFYRVPNPAVEQKTPPSSGTRPSSPESSQGISQPCVTEESLEEKAVEKHHNQEKVYECVFCNHSFKSHYCYQKHKRRHLNPLTVDYETKTIGKRSSSPSPVMSSDSVPLYGNESERKLRILKDINVQFFPCKLCGAKFPSYYFVHKHKKLWHREALEEEERREREKRTQRAKEKASCRTKEKKATEEHELQTN